MTWVDQAIDAIDVRPPWGYAAGGSPATEPTALCALALGASERTRNHAEALRWLAGVQNPDGSLGIAVGRSAPKWPTGWALLAWQWARRPSPAGSPERSDFDGCIGSGLDWLVRSKGQTQARMDWLGHDPTLIGWAWAEGTHSWVEPTAIQLLALKAAGLDRHERARQAVELLTDRLLPQGGCNYGNTTIRGRVLRPHVAPTGLALMALSGEKGLSGRVGLSLDYLASRVGEARSVISLCFGLLGLAAHGRTPSDADRCLAAAYEREVGGDVRPFHLALLALASMGSGCPLIAPAREEGSRS